MRTRLADGPMLFIGFGTYRVDTADGNILEMDNVRVRRM